MSMYSKIILLATVISLLSCESEIQQPAKTVNKCSENCTRNGRCFENAGKEFGMCCSSNESCESSDNCKKYGMCEKLICGCFAKFPDCKVVCEYFGHCKPVQGLCGAYSQKDCDSVGGKYDGFGGCGNE